MRRQKCFILWLIAVFIGLGITSGIAEEAADLTPRCTLSSSETDKEAAVLTDASYKTYLTLQNGGSIWITLPDGLACGGLYLTLRDQVVPYSVEHLRADGHWETLCTPDPSIANMFVLLQEQTGNLRIVSTGVLGISELRVLGKGELPPWVQTWQVMKGKADLMLVVAHPDDELVFLGGTLPYYCGQQHKKTMVVYMTTGYTRRRNELLDGLWLCGVRDYPELCEYRDGFTHLINYSFKLWGGRENVTLRVASFIRQYRPDVIVTQDIVNGEDRHGMHRAAADATVNAIRLAADGTNNAPELSANKPWEPYKMYLHLYRENRIVMPWDQLKLSAFGGKTAADVAKEAFKKHVSQQKTRHKVYLCNPYDSRDFGLYFTRVGEDTLKNDFFEHVPVQP